MLVAGVFEAFFQFKGILRGYLCEMDIIVLSLD